MLIRILSWTGQSRVRQGRGPVLIERAAAMHLAQTNNNPPAIISKTGPGNPKVIFRFSLGLNGGHRHVAIRHIIFLSSISQSETAIWKE
jgi:hypothetical protein